MHARGRRRHELIVAAAQHCVQQEMARRDANKHDNNTNLDASHSLHQRPLTPTNTRQATRNNKTSGNLQPGLCWHHGHSLVHTRRRTKSHIYTSGAEPHAPKQVQDSRLTRFLQKNHKHKPGANITHTLRPQSNTGQRSQATDIIRQS